MAYLAKLKNKGLRRQIMIWAIVFAVTLQLVTPASFTFAEDAVVDTGDATAVAVDQNQTNTNDTSVDNSTDTDVTNSNESDTTDDIDTAATTGDNQASNTDGNASIDTGDSSTGIIVENTINTNTTDVPVNGLECGDPQAPCANATSTETTVSNDNTATSTTEIDGIGSSGDNQASTTNGDASVDTGNVSAEADVSNLVNTNATGEGDLNVVNIYGNAQGDLDVSGTNDDSLGAPTSSADILNGDNIVTATNTSTAALTNDIDLAGSSGTNESTSENSDAAVVTGNAVITANVSNVVNTNIFGNNWDFNVINIFGDWTGDVIFPNKTEEATESLTVSSTANSTEIFVSNENQADLIDDISVLANSGDNIADGLNAVVDTGNAFGLAQIINHLNTNIFGNDWELVKINIFGNWQGQIFGLPAEAEYIRLPNAIVIYNSKLDLEAVMEFILGTGENKIKLVNSNTAVVTNKIRLLADTGNNLATAPNGNATIETGDAVARANVFNQINTNLIGNDWLFGIINVFGNWTGNLEFGRPDLWIQETVEVAQNPMGHGGIITYHFTFGNSGDGRADNVTILDSFADSILHVVEPAGGNSIPGGMEWQINSLKPGEKKTMSYSQSFDNSTLAPGEYEVSNNVTIFSQQDDRNPNNNLSGGVFMALGPNTVTTAGFGSVGANSGGKWPPYLVLEKTHNATSTLEVGEVVSYTLRILNTGDLNSFYTKVKDELRDSSGKVVATNTWDLGQVYADEEIVITYDVQILPSATSGTYTNTAIVEGWDDNFKEWIDDQDSAEIFIINPNPLVATDPTTTEATVVEEVPAEEPADEETTTETTGGQVTVGAPRINRIQHTDEEMAAEAAEVEEDQDEDKNGGFILGSSNENDFTSSSNGAASNYTAAVVLLLIAIMIVLSYYSVVYSIDQQDSKQLKKSPKKFKFTIW